MRGIAPRLFVDGRGPCACGFGIDHPAICLFPCLFPPVDRNEQARAIPEFVCPVSTETGRRLPDAPHLSDEDRSLGSLMVAAT